MKAYFTLLRPESVVESLSIFKTLEGFYRSLLGDTHLLCIHSTYLYIGYTDTLTFINQPTT